MIPCHAFGSKNIKVPAVYQADQLVRECVSNKNWCEW